MKALGRGALTGAGYALAVTGVELWFGGRMLLVNRLTPPVSMMSNAALLAVGLGALLGAALAPIVRGRRAHLLAVAVVWAALELWVTAASTAFRVITLVGPVVGALFVLAGRRLAPRRVAWRAAAGVALVASAVAVPGIYIRVTTPAAPPRAARGTAAPGAPDVVVVVLDTVRADHVSAYGYARPTTPNFDALAAEGALFADATAPATWSLPSHASLFTGLFVSAHGAHDEHKFLDAGPPTLAETLAAAGYDTRCFTANSWISDGLGLTRGFAWCDEAWRGGQVARDFQFVYRLLDRFGFSAPDKGGAEAVGDFEQWAATRPADAPPAYAFLNFIEAHFPYHQLPDDYLRRFTPLSRNALRALSLRLMVAQFGNDRVDPGEAAEPAVAMYDGGVAYADHLLGRVVEALRRRGTLDRTIVVVLADHGELLGEHGEFGHGHSLYEVGIRVPLAVRYPPRVPRAVRVPAPVSTVGVYATVLDLAGLPPAAHVQVGSLAPAIAGGRGGGPVIAEQFRGMLGSRSEPGDPLMRIDNRYRSYRVGSWKLVEEADGTAHLFDLGTDPHEAHDVAGAEGARLAALRAELGGVTTALALPALDAAVARAAPPPVDPAARARLRALGYVE